MFQNLNDLRDAVKACLESDCEYQFFISLGRPPAECNSVAFWYDGSSRSRTDNVDCVTTVFDTDLVVTLTRCCVSADANLEFDVAQEEKDAQCFLNDLEALVNCLTCGAVAELKTLSCGVLVSDIRVDQEKQGGCYSVDIILNVTDEICCITEEEEDA